MSELVLIKVVDALDRLQWIMIGVAILGIITFAVGFYGEIAGWWGDIGIILSVLGIVATGIAAAVALLVGATKREARGLGEDVHQVAKGVGDGNTKLDRANGKLDQANGKLDQANGKLDTIAANSELQTAILREIRDRLPHA